MQLRPFRPADRDDLAEVCVRTADAGGDARGLLRDDRLWGDVFAVPYAVHEPERCTVLDDGGRVVGYVLGTRDTAAFADWYRREWIPAVADRWGTAEPTGDDPADRILRLHLHPERMVHPELAAHPAHLHIDLLPAAQRQGWGRRLIEAFLAGLARDGVGGVHLGMARANRSARAFYEALGFSEAPVDDGPESTILVRGTQPL